PPRGRGRPALPEPHPPRRGPASRRRLLRRHRPLGWDRIQAAMNEEQQRIRSYLVAQGAKLTPAAIVEKVQAAMADLRAAAVAGPWARFGERAARTRWRR